ncbi:MAG: hypothetical protein KGZ79_07785 [Dethiobacter sp.]|nr:hypothetical protein [Dethiobacter sp.]
MSWVKQSVTNEHQNELPGMELLAAFKGEILFLEGKAEVELLAERPYDVLEEFVIRCLIELDPKPQDLEIASLLGFGDTLFISPITEQLERLGDISLNSNRQREVSERLVKYFKQKKWLTPELKNIDFWFNPYLKSAYFQEPRNFIKTANDIFKDQFIGEFTHHTFEEWLVDAEGPLSLKEVNSVEVSFGETGALPVDIIIYADPIDDTWAWDVYNHVTNRIEPYLRDAAEMQGAQEECERVLKEFEEKDAIHDYNVELAQRQRLELIESKASTSSDKRLILKRLSTLDVDERLKELISESKEEVILVFPWIKTPALSLTDVMQRAVDNGAQVYISYGIQLSPTVEDSFDDVIAKLRRISSKDGKCHVSVLWTGGSHIKECVFDRKHYMIGSHNRLSYKGDPDRYTGNVRREAMLYTNHQDPIKECLNETLPLIKGSALEQAKNSTIITCSDWMRAWFPVLQLDKNIESFQASLDNLPDDLPSKIEALSQVVIDSKLLKVDGFQHAFGVACHSIIEEAATYSPKSSLKSPIKKFTKQLNKHKEISKSMSDNIQKLKQFNKKK